MASYAVLGSIKMFPESVKHAAGNIVVSYAFLVSGMFQIQMFPYRPNTPQGTFVASYAVLVSGKFVFRSKCPPESVKHATENIVASYAVLGSSSFCRS